jgi:hypothetical protein
MSQHESRAASLISVSCPGGMARQYRVQVASRETPSRWKLVGSFSDERQADACAACHSQAGEIARVILCSALPTAA